METTDKKELPVVRSGKRSVFESIKNWLRNTLSGMVATTLGIILTFGTSEYIENQKKKEMAHTTIMMTMKNISISASGLDAAADTLLKADSVLQYFMKLYPDSLDNASPEMAKLFNQSLIKINYNINDESAEKIFSSNIATWDNIKDHDLINAIGSLFTMIRTVKEIKSKMDAERMELFYDIMSSDELNDIKSEKEFVKAMMKKKEIRKFIFKSGFNAQLIKLNTSMMLKQIDEILKKQNITKEELYMNDSTFSNIKEKRNYNF